MCSDTTLWRTLNQDLTPGVVGAVWAAVADVRAEVWARSSATTGNDPVVSDIDAWLVEIHSENKEGSAAGLVTVTPGTSGRSGCTCLIPMYGTIRMIHRYSRSAGR